MEIYCGFCFISKLSIGCWHLKTKQQQQKFFWSYLHQEQQVMFSWGNGFSIKRQIPLNGCFIEFSKKVVFFKFTCLNWDHWKSISRMLSEHRKSIFTQLWRGPIFFYFTLSLSILLFWARKASNDTLLASKVSITVHIIIPRVLLYFSTFWKSYQTQKICPFVSILFSLHQDE